MAYPIASSAVRKAICTVLMYTCNMKNRLKSGVPFTEVRQRLTAILDSVEKSGKPVTILRRGKPAAVIISHEAYAEQFTKARPRFRLAGSLKVAAGVDIDKVLEKAKQERIRVWQKRLKRWRDEG